MEWKKETLKVLHIPKLKKKLFSAKQFDRVGGEIYIKSGICTFTKKK